MHSVIVVDDHPFVRAGVKAFLSKNNFNVIAEAGNGQDAIKLAREHQPDLIVLDIGIPNLDGFEVISRLSGVSSLIKILVLSAQPPEQFSDRCKKAGASGYVCKNQQLTELIKAARAVMEGYSYFPDIAFSSVASMDSEAQRVASLSEREVIVLQYFAKGMSNIEIGEALFLSNKTISTHKARMLAKLGLNSVVEMVDLAKRMGLI